MLWQSPDTEYLFGCCSRGFFQWNVGLTVTEKRTSDFARNRVVRSKRYWQTVLANI